MSATSKPAIPARERLIVALDLPDADQARRAVEELDGAAVFFKIGLQLQLAGGIELARELVRAGRKVFLDFKLYDIGETVKHATARAADLGVTFLTVHGNGAIVAAAAAGKGANPLQLLAVTVLTSLDEADIRELGFPCDVPTLVRHRARRSVEAGAAGLVCSGLEVASLRADLGAAPLLVVPGIRPGGAEVGDQKRVVTPARAIADGADYLVVGRPIVGAADRRAAAQAIQAEIAAALA